jgi:hypothetical protein
MHPDDLKVVWRCGNCSRTFVFHSDAIDHESEFKHKMKTLELPSGKSSRLEPFDDGQATINFRIDSKRVQMRVSYRYYPRSRRIVYLDVEYSEPMLAKKIEGSAEMMRKVDMYLRTRITEGANTDANPKMQQ